MNEFAKLANSLFFWVFALAIVAVLAGGHTAELITNVGKLVSTLTGMIVNPQSGGGGGSQNQYPNPAAWFRQTWHN